MTLIVHYDRDLQALRVEKDGLTTYVKAPEGAFSGVLVDTGGVLTFGKDAGKDGVALARLDWDGKGALAVDDQTPGPVPLTPQGSLIAAQSAAAADAPAEQLSSPKPAKATPAKDS